MVNTLLALLFCFALYCIYKFFSFFFPSKNILISRCYNFVLQDRKRVKAGEYEFMRRGLEKNFSRNVRGITKRNRRYIAEMVIEKLIQDKIIHQVPDIILDVYRDIHVETIKVTSIIETNDTKH